MREYPYTAKSMTLEEMAAELRKAGFKVDDVRNCTHPPEYVWGSGTCSSDGSSKFSGQCRRCGKSLHYDTTPADRKVRSALVPFINWTG